MSRRDRPGPRQVALEILDSVLGHHRPLDETLERHGDMAALESRDRALARTLVATTLRRLGQIDTLIRLCLSRRLPPKAARARDVLRLGVCQLLFLEMPPHAAVSTAVDLAEPPYKRLVNAILRRLEREGRVLLEPQDAARLNTPDWLWTSWTETYGPELCRAIATAHLREPPLDITVRDSAEPWASRLDADLLPTGTLRRRLSGSGLVSGFPGFAEGHWWIQDAAAALPARLLGPVAGRRVVDLCAAPGGKTAQLCAAGALVTAVESSASRMERLTENLNRLALKAETVVADAAQWRPATPVDAVLLDAPCTATGTIRRHPDVARLKSADDVKRLARVQRRLLDAAIAMLAPGGTLVYCACSLQSEEGVDLIATALSQGAPLARVPLDPESLSLAPDWVTVEGDLRTLPCHLGDQGGLDGFFAARLVRT